MPGGIEQELARLERLIGTLQGMHKLALRPMQSSRTEIAIERVVRACAANFEPAAAQAEITLAVEMPANLARVRADEDRIIQVLTNLLDNAAKFTPPGGRITIAAGEDEQRIWATVANTGAGIAPDELPHIFQQFYSGQSRPPEKRGMGLGRPSAARSLPCTVGKLRSKASQGKARGSRLHYRNRDFFSPQQNAGKPRVLFR